MIKKSRFIIASLLLGLLVGCSSQQSISKAPKASQKQVMRIPASFLSVSGSEAGTAEGSGEDAFLANSDNTKTPASSVMQSLDPISWPTSGPRTEALLSDLVPDSGSLEVTAERMSARDFINYTFGELLRLNYVLDESIGKGGDRRTEGITLNLSDPVSSRDLFVLISELLAKKGIEISFGSGTFFVNKPNEGGGERKAIIGVGRTEDEVPNTVQNIVQVVPLEYGIKLNVERTLRSLLKAKITPDFEQSALFIEGTRDQILHALELVDLLDTPATRSQHVGLIGLNFLTPEAFTRDVALLLENEGILTSIGKPDKRNVVMVPLQQLGAVAIFAVSESLLSRVQQWASLIDVPGEGSNEQYFIFHPKNARAIDLGESISGLLGAGSIGSRSMDASSEVNSSRTTGSVPSRSRTTGIAQADLKMVVDERANALIFYTSGSKYRVLLPLMNKLDTMPQQVLLDITIAEVTLKDEFKYGVEWALSRGEVNVVTQGGFGVGAIGGMGLTIDGAEGPLDANFLNTNSLVKVLSKPSLLVRDGVTANINVGSDISVVGETTQDPISGERQTTTAQYRKTGVDVTVTPTVNAQGVVVMEISQTISNTVPSSSGASGNPDIFERSLSTELVAKSGQTVMMAGLISESGSNGGSGTPGISKLPLLGNLFKASSDSSDRTELVMLITPRIIEDLDQWDGVMDDFRGGLRYLDLKEE